VRRRWTQIVDRWETWWWVFSAGRSELLARFCQEVPALPGMVGELGGARADAGGGEQSLSAASIDHRMLGEDPQLLIRWEFGYATFPCENSPILMSTIR